MRSGLAPPATPGLGRHLACLQLATAQRPGAAIVVPNLPSGEAISSADCPTVMAEEVSAKLIDHAERLQREVDSMRDLFGRTQFMGDSDNRPFAHYGYLMALLGLVDVLSRCNEGRATVTDTARMRAFLEKYVRPGKGDVHAVLVQMLRHTLMHTGALRFLYDGTTKTAFTWRVYFGPLPDGVEHYTVTDVDSRYQDVLLAAAAEIHQTPRFTRALNISVPDLAADLLEATNRFTAAMLADSAKRRVAEAAFPRIEMQKKHL